MWIFGMLCRDCEGDWSISLDWEWDRIQSLVRANRTAHKQKWSEDFSSDHSGMMLFRYINQRYRVKTNCLF